MPTRNKRTWEVVTDDNAKLFFKARSREQVIEYLKSKSIWPRSIEVHETYSEAAEQIKNSTLRSQKRINKKASKKLIDLCSSNYHASDVDLAELLDNGADPNAAVGNLSALHYAAGIMGNPNASQTKILLMYGASPNITCPPQNWTPLHVALFCTHVNSQVIITLLAGGADPNLIDNSGKSPFDWAKSSFLIGENKISAEAFRALEKCSGRVFAEF